MEAIGTFAGASALIVVLLNIGKALGWVKDGQAAGYSEFAHSALFSITFLVKTLFPEVDLGVLDGFAQQLADLGVMIVPVIPTVIAFADKFYQLIKGTTSTVPIASTLTFSYSK